MNEIQPKKVGFLLGFGVFLIPIVFVWFLFRKGYSVKARIIGLAWLILPIFFINGAMKGAENKKNSLSTNTAPTTQTNSISNSQNKTPQETIIPRRDAGDKGKYYLLEAKQEGGIFKVLHKRVGVDTTGYTKTEINCSNMKFRVMGYSEISANSIVNNPTAWADIVEGSSKSDLVHFICKK